MESPNAWPKAALKTQSQEELYSLPLRSAPLFRPYVSPLQKVTSGNVALTACCCNQNQVVLTLQQKNLSPNHHPMSNKSKIKK